MPVMPSVRLAARRLLHGPTFTLAAVLTLTLGIGATTAVFSVLNAVLLRPLPYGDPDGLVSLSHTLVISGISRVDQSDASFLFYERHARALRDLGAYQATSANLGPMGGGPRSGADAERASAARVTSGVFTALRVAPLMGRLFTKDDDAPRAAPVVLLGQGLWERKYGGDASILGRRIEVDRVPREVVGIMPARLRFPLSDTQLWIPMQFDPARTESSMFDYQALARLRDGVSTEAAAADLQAWLPSLPDEFPGRMTRASLEQTHMRAVVRPLREVVVGDIVRLLWVVMAAVGFVLAVACANVANLFLVRAEGRQREIAVQRALGAPAGAVLMEFLSEGLLVAAFGGVLGMLAAMGGIRVLQAFGNTLDIPRLAEVRMDAVVLIVAAGATLLAALFVSALPALRSRTVSAAAMLTASGRTATAGRERHRTRKVLVASQVALALVLLVGSGLMARSVWRLRSVEPGFDPRDALSFRVALPPASYPTADVSVRFFMQVVDGVSAVGGVEAAGAISKLPLEEQGRADSAVFIEDRPVPQGSLPGVHPVSYVTPDYFRAAGIPFLSGRRFERPNPPSVLHDVIVSRAFAERYWKEESPIGRRVRIYINGPWYTVIGVVGDVHDRTLTEAADQMIYCPLVPAVEDPRWTPRDLAVVVRSASGTGGGVAGAVRDVVRRLDSSLPVYRLRPLSDVLAQASARTSFTFVLLGCASLVALVLGAIGLYGVMSYVVTLRTREIGLRLALGAQPHEVRRMVSRQGMVTAAVGIAVGLVGAVTFTRVLATLLFEVSATDPLVFLGAAGLLTLVAIGASWLPARQAASVNPSLALRAE